MTKRILLLALMILSSTVHAEDLVVRIATFNIEEFSWEKLERVDADGKGTDPQLVAAASIIQQVRPDVLLINEIDYTGIDDSDAEVPAERSAIEAFLKRYLKTPQAGAKAITYPYTYYRPTNTGVPTGHDFNNDGKTTGPEVAWGFGRYPGQYGMGLVSRFPIESAKARTFRKLLWKQMPGRGPLASSGAARCRCGTHGERPPTCLGRSAFLMPERAWRSDVESVEQFDQDH